MRALVTRLMPDKRREKVMVTGWPEPKSPHDNQIKTRTVYSGITNGTERNDLLAGNYAHKDEDLPGGWGYQNVGCIIEVGPRVESLKVGDLVYMSADHVEYVVMPEDGLLVKLPEQVDPKHAALFGMSSVAMHTCRNTGLSIGDKLLVVGAGFIGQVVTQIAASMGMRVTLCDVDSRRLALAGQIGAAEAVVDVTGDGWEKQIAEQAFDAVVDVAGVAGMEDRLIAAARHRGQVLFIAGRFRISYTFNLGQGREITIKQNSHFTSNDLANLCRLVSRGIVQIGQLIQDVVPVDQADRIYTILRDKPNELLGTVFVW